MLTKDDHGRVADDAGRGPGERAAAEPAGAASIDKVRDILFGNQVREFARRFARLEDRLVRETNELKAQLTARVEALEAFTRKEAEALADQIKAEHADRVDAQGQASRELKAAADALERRTATLDDQLTRGQREVRQQLLDQNQRLSDDIRRRTDEVLAALSREAQELRSDKADRSTIAALFNEMAMRLTADFAPLEDEDRGHE
jgi:DNA repair exonuclease SbcCD ATPase subunit